MIFLTFLIIYGWFSRLFNKMDANEDRKLIINDVKGSLLNDFGRIDVDSDGFFSDEEVAEAAQKGENGQRILPMGGQGGRPPR